MRNIFKKYKFFLIAAGLALAWPAIGAGLVPDCEGYGCTVCHLLLLISNIFSFIVKKLMPPLAGLLFLVGGIMMIASAGSEERYKKGRQVLINVAIGVVIVLLSWVVVNTLITTFGSSSVPGFSASGWWNPSMTCTAPAPAANTNNSSISQPKAQTPNDCTSAQVWDLVEKKCVAKPPGMGTAACDTVGVCTEALCAPSGKCGPSDPWVPNCCSCGYVSKLCSGGL